MYQGYTRYRNTHFQSAISAPKSAVLDGTIATTAWSMSRSLYSNFPGSLYEPDGSNVKSIVDQSPNPTTPAGTNGVVALEPALNAAGPHNIRSALFNGTSNAMALGDTGEHFIDPAGGYIVISAIVRSITLNSSNTWQNDLLIGDGQFFWGIYLLNSVPQTVRAFNWDGTDDFVSANISLNTPYVFAWRHQGGNLFLSVNGAPETSVASGNTTDVTGFGRLGGISSSAQNANVDFFEAVIYDSASIPSAATRTSIVTNFMSNIGA